MGILNDINLDNIPEEKVLPDGEYEVQILEAGEYIGTQSGKVSIRVILQVLGEGDVQDIFIYLGVPKSEDDARTVNRKLRRIRDFLSSFGISQSADYQEWKGKRAWAFVTVGQDQNGEPRNDIKRFIGSTSRPSSGTDTLPFDV